MSNIDEMKNAYVMSHHLNANLINRDNIRPPVKLMY